MGDEGKPSKKLKIKGKMKRLDRPPDNPVVDVRKYIVIDISHTRKTGTVTVLG